MFWVQEISCNHYPELSKGFLPIEHSTQSLPFQIIGVDYTNLLIYKTKEGKEARVYILLFICNFTRATYLEL